MAGTAYSTMLRQGHLQRRADDEKLRRCRLHAGRARDGHGAGRKVELLNAGLVDHLAGPLHVPAEQVGGVVVDEEHAGPDVEPLPGGADDEGRLAALGDRDDDVVPLHPRFFDLVPAEVREILESLHRLDQREIPAGHDADAQVRHLGNLPASMRRQNSRQAASNRMLNRPVAPQPVK